MLLKVDLYLVTEVSGQLVGTILKGQAVHDEVSRLFMWVARNVTSLNYGIQKADKCYLCFVEFYVYKIKRIKICLR